MTDPNPDLAKILHLEAEAAERAAMTNPEAEFPADAVITQPNRTRMLTVRLRDSEYAAIQQAAERQHLPVSALARSLLLINLNA